MAVIGRFEVGGEDPLSRLPDLELPMVVRPA
jgi:hypothetical protein